ALQAFRGLDLDRLPADGAGRPARGHRPALSLDRADGATGPLRRRSGPMTRYLLPLGVFALLVVLLGVGLSLNPREVPSPLIGKPARAFQLPQLHDASKTFSPQEQLGKVWVLNVWASWCVACREEHPVLSDFANSGIVPVFGLNYKDKREDAIAWLQRYGN